MIRKNLFCLLMVAAASAAAVELTDAERAEIEARIAPIGEVCLQGDDSCGSAAPVAAATSGARSGKDVYDTTCFACHATGAAGAPKFGDAAAWADRIAKGTDALHNSALNGVPGTGMMAKGGCATCSDEEIIAASDYMIENAQ